MNTWIIQDGEPIPGVDENTRDLRAAMLAKALVVQGHEVLWWASTFDHARKRHRFDASRTVELQPGLKVRLLHGPGYSHNTSPARLWHQRTLAQVFSREITDCRAPDLIFCSLPTLEFAEICVGYGWNRVPVLIDVRDAWPDLYLNLFPFSVRRFARLFLVSEFRRAKYIFRMATGVTAVSFTYLDWALHYAKRSRRSEDGVFPLGYSARKVEIQPESQKKLIQQRYGIQSGVLVVSFIGAFGASYDLDTIVKAAHLLQSEGKWGVQFVLAGDGDKAHRLHETAFGLSNVVFTGWLDQSSLEMLMQITDIGLAAYTKDALQSLPNKPFEYMAAGLPLLSSLSGELERLITDHQIGLHYRAGDEKSLVEKIAWLTEHPAERVAMGQRARRLFEERFRADIIYPKLVAHLEQVAANATTTSSEKSFVDKEA